MLYKITLLTSFSFAVFYPLCFFISAHNPLKNFFHRFHIGLPTIVAWVIIIFTFMNDIVPTDLRWWMLGWGVTLILVTFYCWQQEYLQPRLIIIPTVLGIIAYVQLQNFVLQPDLRFIIISILSACIFCAALFAMNLGHWYLNVHGLPIEHLVRATYTFWFLLALRAVWDIYFLLTFKIMYDGDLLSLIQFMTTLDGFFLSLGLFFGTIMPIGALFFVREILKLKNTQATTGMLYVILCAILIGDLVYKYYLIKYGIPL